MKVAERRYASRYRFWNIPCESLEVRRSSENIPKFKVKVGGQEPPPLVQSWIVLYSGLWYVEKREQLV